MGSEMCIRDRASDGVLAQLNNLTISQSIVSGNVATSASELEANGILSVVTLDDYNLFGLADDSCVGGTTVGVMAGMSDIVPTEMLLSDIVDTTLADNRGPTPTHALPMGSPAIDAVPAASCASVTDQTGKVRPQDGNGDMAADCDIGAFEVEGLDLDLIFENGFEAPDA